MHINLSSAAGIEPEGQAIVLTGHPWETNDLSNPRQVVPVTTNVRDMGQSFDYSLPSYSVTVLKLKVEQDGNEEHDNQHSHRSGPGKYAVTSRGMNCDGN